MSIRINNVLMFLIDILTQRECDLVTHAKQLSKAENSLLRVETELSHPADTVSDSVSVVACHHNSNLLRIISSVLESLDSGETFIQHRVIHGRSGIVVSVDGVLVTQQLSSCSLLLHVGSPYKLGAIIKVLTLGLLQIQGDGLQCLLEITLLSVEDNCALCVVGSHHFNSQSGDRKH